MKRQGIPAPLGRGVCQKDVFAFAVGEGGRFVKVRPAVIVDIEVDLPVGNWDFSGIGRPLALRSLYFVPPMLPTWKLPMLTLPMSIWLAVLMSLIDSDMVLKKTR